MEESELYLIFIAAVFYTDLFGQSYLGSRRSRPCCELQIGGELVKPGLYADQRAGGDACDGGTPISHETGYHDPAEPARLGQRRAKNIRNTRSCVGEENQGRPVPPDDGGVAGRIGGLMDAIELAAGILVVGNAKFRRRVAVILPLVSPEMRAVFFRMLRSKTMRTTIAVALAAGAWAFCGLPSAQAADFSVQPQVAAPAPDYGPPPVAENYAYPPPPPVAYGYPPPPPPGYYVYGVPAYAVWPGPYGPYWRGYGPRFAFGGPWRGHWGRGWHR